MRPRIIQRYVGLILQCVYRAFVFPFAIRIGRYCQIFLLKKIYVCSILAIPIIYVYAPFSVMVNNFMSNTRNQRFVYPIKDYQENENYNKIILQKKSQKYDELIKLSKIQKFILLWNWPNVKSFHHIPEGHEIFTKYKCRYRNCFITGNKYVFSDIRYFHAIAFGPETTYMKPDTLPEQRSPYQKYIFFSKEPPQMNPACDEKFDNFFNWTWTYKLDSDIRWGLVIRDSNDIVVGPKPNMKWIFSNTSSVRNNLESENEDQKKILSKKYFAAAWIALNEWSFNSRERLIAQLRVALGDFNLKVDFIGSHGRRCADNSTYKTCDDILEDYYYFYFAFEKAMSKDYVTPMLLHALQHNVVPVVFGGADYTRFLPPDSYLNANLLSPNRLAGEIATLIQYHQEYLKYFEWRKHYSYHETNNRPDTNEYCQLCALLNRESFEETSVYKDFRTWWNSPECKSEMTVLNEFHQL